MQPKYEGDEEFVMVHQRDLVGTMELVRQRRLELRDMAVLMALSAHVQWRSGRAWVTVKALANQLGMNVSSCADSVRRLQREGQLVRCADERTGGSFFLLNPFVISVGGPQRRGLLWKMFEEATRAQGEAHGEVVLPAEDDDLR